MDTIKGISTSFWLGLFFFASVVAFFEAPPAWALGRDWKKIEVPGSFCGDGQSYTIFVSPGKPDKIAFELMGGGACWNSGTCYAFPDTWIHPLPTVVENGGILSPDPEKSPITDYTTVYFPYCTGDVHLGKHVAHYVDDHPFYHTGATNIVASIQRLLDTRTIDLEHAKSFVMLGFSAGAIGALYHAAYIAPYIARVPDKVLIADAPGLHFGPTFWDKFTPELLVDIGDAMKVVDMKIELGDGDIAELIPKACKILPDWRVGVLQGARDIIMSVGFGAISEDDHEKLVYGPSGVFQLTASDANDNCSAWIPRTQMHTFMVTDLTAGIRAQNGESAMDYARNLIIGKWGRHSSGPTVR